MANTPTNLPEQTPENGARLYGKDAAELPNDDASDALKDRIRELEKALGLKDEGLAAFRLPPTLNDLFGLLLSVPQASPDLISQRLEISTCTKVAVHRLRHALKPWNIEIHSKRGIGYWIDEATKVRVREMVTSQVTAVAA
jgi:hypothetical protein